MSLQSFINQTLNEQQIEYKQVLDPDNKSELKTHYFDDTVDNLNCKCPITMTPFNNGDIITQLPCGHLFSTDAIEEWVLENKASCPVCRHKLKHTKEIRITPEVSQQEIVDNSIDSNERSRRLIRSLMSYIIGDPPGLNQIINPIPNDLSFNPININAVNNDISNNNISNNDISNNDISNNDIFENDASNNIQEIDPVLNSINNYISTINRIMDRRIQREDDNIMQQAILASLREQ